MIVIAGVIVRLKRFNWHHPENAGAESDVVESLIELVKFNEALKDEH